MKLSGYFLLAAVGGLTLGTPAVRAAGVLIPATNRVDATHDDTRDLVYVTNGDSILRYDPVAGTFLTPFVLEPGLRGLDLSPDGSMLAVACGTYAGTENWIYLVNPEDGTATKVSFTRNYGEAGTFTVKWTADGLLYISSGYAGSGWVPLRRYDPASGTTTVVRNSVEQNTMLATSGDGLTLVTAGANLSSGPFATYDLTLSTWKTTGSTGWFNFEAAASADGSQLAVPTYSGTFVYDRNFTKLATLGVYAGQTPIGVAYHPVEDLIYLPIARTAEVRIFDTTSFAQTGSINVGSMFSWGGNGAFIAGRTRLSLDGSRLLVTVTGGVQLVPLYAPLEATDSAVETNEDQAASIALGATIGNGGAIEFETASGPAHGTLSGSAPNLTYTPAPDFNGTDSITFRARYGAAVRTASVQISVNPQNDAPVAAADSFTVRRYTMTPLAVQANDRDVDGDPLTVVRITQPARGMILLLNGSVYYWAHSSYTGTLNFNYTVADAAGATSTAPVTLRIVK